jgi:hypothetical protein
VYLKRFRKSTDLQIVQLLLEASAKIDHKMISLCNKQVLRYLVFSHLTGPLDCDLLGSFLSYVSKSVLVELLVSEYTVIPALVKAKAMIMPEGVQREVLKYVY